MIATYHSFMWWIISCFGRYLGLPKTLDVLGRTRTRIVKALAQREAIDPDARARFYAESLGGLPFEEFLPVTRRALEGSNVLLTELRGAFAGVLVDEFQDTDDSQWEFIKLLSEGNRLVCFADPDQLIHRWRGASDDRLARFVKETGAVERRLQEKCLRTDDHELLDFAEAILDNQPGTRENRGRRRERFLVPYPGMNACGYHLKKLIREFSRAHTARGRDGRPTIACAAFSNRAAKTLRDYLGRKTDAAPYAYQCTLLEAEPDEALDELILNIAEWSGGGSEGPLERALQILGGILAPDPDHASGAIQSLFASHEIVTGARQPRGVARKAWALLQTLNVPASRSMEEAFGRARDSIMALRASFTVVRKSIDEEDLEERFTALMRLASQHQEDILLSSLHAVRRAAMKGRLQETILERTLPVRGVSSSTLHKLKGRQFDYVCIVTIGNDKLHGGSGDETDARRLLYVALTRARHDARILYVQSAPAPLLEPYFTTAASNK